jgi:heme o synthase
VPRILKTYYRLTKPGIIYGNILTATGGFFLASKGQIDWWLLFATLAGMSLIIASGCVFNNYIDRGIDKKMARTRKRALVSGLIPIRNALISGTVIGCSGVVVLSLWTNLLVVTIGLTAWFFYVVLYAVAKRRSVHGTLVGTIPGAAPPIAGYAAATGHLDSGALILFLIMVFWQMPHFYAIALYRFKDYKAAGLPVLPVKKGAHSTKTQILAYIAGFIIATAMLSIFGYTGLLWVVVMASLGLYWLWLGMKGFNSVTNDTIWARKMFMFSLVIITAMSALLSINAWLPGNII